jgi:hypothetical protein
VRRHDLDLTALIAGVVLLALGLYLALGGTEWVDLDLRWIAPLALLGLGGAGLFAAIRSSDDGA